MSELEEQAKTIREIQHIYNYDCQNREQRLNLLKEKWVPLESAQKLQDELIQAHKCNKLLGEYNAKLTKEIEKYKAKLTEVKQELDKWILCPRKRDEKFIGGYKVNQR